MEVELWIAVRTFNMNENREHQKDAMPGLASLYGIE